MSLWLARASRLIFKGLHVAQAVGVLPKKLSDPLRYREEWELSLTRPSDRPTLWIHGASVGELEDLANFFLDEGALKDAGFGFGELVITASSPSAKPFLSKILEKLPVAYAGPLPSEDPEKIDRFLEALKPELLILSHSDLWPLLMHRAQALSLKRGIVWMPTRANSAERLMESIVRPEKLRAVGVRAVDEMQHFKARLANFPRTRVTWIGNPRLDRIASRIDEQRSRHRHVLEDSRASPDPGKFSILLGSVWPEDAAVMSEALKALPDQLRELIQIVAMPHVTEDEPLAASIQKLLPMARVLRIQGLLLEAYQDFKLALVGGGFRTGLHSVLEPALWGIPVVCGPELRKQPEAVDLQMRGALHPVGSARDLTALLKNYLSRPQTYLDAVESSRRAADGMKGATGASKRLSHLVAIV